MDRVIEKMGWQIYKWKRKETERCKDGWEKRCTEWQMDMKSESLMHSHLFLNDLKSHRNFGDNNFLKKDWSGKS